MSLEKAIEILGASPHPMKTAEVLSELKKKYNFRGSYYQVRDFLYGRRNEDVIYRSKPHYDYQLKELKSSAQISNVNYKIQYTEYYSDSLFSVSFDSKKVECVGIVNLSSPLYPKYESVIVDIVRSFQEIYMTNDSVIAKKVIAEFNLHLQ